MTRKNRRRQRPKSSSGRSLNSVSYVNDVGVKAIDQNNKVIFYSTATVKDTVDGMWVSGLPETVNLIVSGQEYISIGETIN